MMSRSIPTLLIASVLLALCGSPVQATAGQSADGAFEAFAPTPVEPNPVTRAILDSYFFDYDVVELPVAAVEHRLSATGRVGLILRGELHELELDRVDLFTPDYRGFLITDVGPVEIERPDPATYQGTLADSPDALVALTVTPGFFTVSIRREDSQLFVDPLRDFVPGGARQTVVVYTDSDVRPETLGDCGTEGRPGLATRRGSLLGASGLVDRAHTTLRRLDVATDADGEYFASYGSPGTFNRIAAIVNDADVAYQRDVNLDLNISFQQAWSNASTDPYVSTNSSIVLQELRNWWNTNRSGTNRDAAHLFSGKNFDGSVIGRAYLDAVCANPSLAYGINQDYGGSFVRAELFAHELGHNLSARHDDQIPCSGVSCNGFGPIMCSFIQSSGSFTFSSCSQDAIDTFTHNNGGCLN
jgi:hypothetical protein